MDAQKDTGYVASVLFVNTSVSWGGGELWHGQMAIELLQRGWNIHVFCAPNSALKRWLVERIFPPHHIHELYEGNSAIFSLSVRKRIRLALRDIKPSHVLLNSPLDVKVVAPIARSCGVPDIVYRRGSAIPVKDTWLNRWLLNHKVHRFIANSEATKDTLTSTRVIQHTDSRISVQYNGLDLARFTRGHKETSTSNRTQLVVGALGRLTHQKGFDILLQAIPIVLQELPETVFRIGGSGDQEQALRTQIAELGIESAVDMLGFVSDTPAFFQDIDVFCLPSRWEGFGFVLAEAMASGLPCIAFDVSNISEIVVNRETGLLAQDTTPAALASSLIEVLINEQLRTEFGEAARTRVEEHYSLDAAVDRLVAFLSAYSQLPA